MYRTDSLTAAGKASYEGSSESIFHRIGKYTKVIMFNAFNMFERVTSTIFVTSEWCEGEILNWVFVTQTLLCCIFASNIIVHWYIRKQGTCSPHPGDRGRQMASCDILLV